MFSAKTAYLLTRKLIKNGNLTLNLIDLSQIFKDESRQTFSDGCCHLNKLGNSLMTKEMVKVIKRTYSEITPLPRCQDDFRTLIETMEE